MIGHTTNIYFRPLPKGVPWGWAALVTVHLLASIDPSAPIAMLWAIQGLLSAIQATTILWFWCIDTRTVQSWTIMPSKKYPTPMYIPKRKRRASTWLQVRWKKVADCWWIKLDQIAFQIKTTKGKPRPSLWYRKIPKHKQMSGLMPNNMILNCFVTIKSNSKTGYTASNQVHLAKNHFDSDSYPILIDNCCSACITNCIADFNCKPVWVNANINRLGGAIQLIHKGTVKWSFQDNEERPHTFLIKESYYAPNAPCQLFDSILPVT